MTKAEIDIGSIWPNIWVWKRVLPKNLNLTENEYHNHIDWRENQAQTDNQDTTDNQSIEGNNSNLHVDYRGRGKTKIRLKILNLIQFWTFFKAPRTFLWTVL